LCNTGTNICDGDLGENFILVGPDWEASGMGLHVGTVLKLGEKVVIELTEANEPCYRMQHLPWAAAAKRVYGKSNTDPRFEEKWWDGPSCVLSKEGGRGWLARVLVEGEVAEGNVCTVVSESVIGGTT
jgi:MOSC domain-containing protein YiiM